MKPFLLASALLLGLSNQAQAFNSKDMSVSTSTVNATQEAKYALYQGDVLPAQNLLTKTAKTQFGQDLPLQMLQIQVWVEQE